MSERLIASTTNGWTKYVTDTGREKYKRPNGRYANKHQYWGSLSHAEEIDETEEPGFVPPIRDYEIEERDDLESYAKAVDYNFPVDKEICGGQGVNWKKQFNRLWDVIQEIRYRYDEFSFGIEYVVFDENGDEFGSSEKHTTLQPYEDLKPRSELSFYRFGEAIEKLCDSYTQVLVTEVRIKGRTMQEQWR